MNFYEWMEKFYTFLLGYYAGLPLEKKCRTATEIITEAIQAYLVACNETDWITKKEDDHEQQR